RFSPGCFRGLIKVVVVREQRLGEEALLIRSRLIMSDLLHAFPPLNSLDCACVRGRFLSVWSAQGERFQQQRGHHTPQFPSPSRGLRPRLTNNNRLDDPLRPPRSQ
ncbi:unnamed protein product, partial [Ectocarpus fasciculatus]